MRNDTAGEVEAILRTQTLYEWAASREQKRPLRGRAIAWAVSLPGGTPIVVRHSQHGGLLAPLTGDRFLKPRAPHELETALWLEAAGVPTPPIIAYAVYRAGPLLKRSDVASREVGSARDMGYHCMSGGNALNDALECTATLLQRMAAAGAHHPDLNVKNVLISEENGVMQAWLLDVDRVRRVTPAEAMRGNVQRLTHSMRRWIQRHGASISAEQIARISRLAAT